MAWSENSIQSSGWRVIRASLVSEDGKKLVRIIKISAHPLNLNHHHHCYQKIKINKISTNNKTNNKGQSKFTDIRKYRLKLSFKCCFPLHQRWNCKQGKDLLNDEHGSAYEQHARCDGEDDGGGEGSKQQDAKGCHRPFGQTSSHILRLEHGFFLRQRDLATEIVDSIFTLERNMKTLSVITHFQEIFANLGKPSFKKYRNFMK